jgi:ribosomal protein S18 acetylase RimI-like enzyme
LFRPAKLFDLPEVVETYTQAFNDDPFNRWLIRNDEQRSKALREYHAFRLGRNYPAGGVYTSQNHLVCSTWVPSDYKPTELTADERRLLESRRKFWFTEGGVWKYEAMSRLIEERTPSFPHWDLDMLGVRPEAQGRGLGAEHVNARLRVLDGLDVPVYLTSSNVRNVPFYERLGFRVVDSFHLPDGPVVTCMLRNPLKVRE